MSIENEAAEAEQDLNELTEEVVSEQPEPEDNQDVANPDSETEQVDETEENEFLIKALSGEAEPEEDGKTKNIPRSTAKAIRKNKRLEAENQRLQERIQEIEQTQAPQIQPKIPERDWDNETEEQFQFKMQSAVYQHNQQQQQSQALLEQQKKQAIEEQKAAAAALEKYAEEADKLGFKGYDEVEESVLDGMHPLTLETMTKYNAQATPKIIVHLRSNPELKQQLANASHNNVAEFNRLFGKLEAKVESIEAVAKQRRKQVSRAPSDEAVSGSGSASDLQSKIDKAADAGKWQLYRELKAKQKQLG